MPECCHILPKRIEKINYFVSVFIPLLCSSLVTYRMKDEAIKILRVLNVVQRIGKEMRKYFLALENVLLQFYLGNCRYTFAVTEY